jgi:hypothetical protein
MRLLGVTALGAAVGAMHASLNTVMVLFMVKLWLVAVAMARDMR